MAVQLSGDDFGRMLVGGQILDSLEPASGCCTKTFEKRDFLKYEAEIGGEFWHGRVLFAGSAGEGYS
jgi:hypothetical protein